MIPMWDAANSTTWALMTGGAFFGAKRGRGPNEYRLNRRWELRGVELPIPYKMRLPLTMQGRSGARAGTDEEVFVRREPFLIWKGNGSNDRE